MRSRLCSCAAVVAALIAASPVYADIVNVTVNGTVAFNGITLPPLSGFASGAPASMSFSVDSANFLDSPNFPTRGYPIDPSSFVLSSGAASIGLQNPFPAGQTPYFVLRNNDPAVDGFIVSTSNEFQDSVPIDQTHTTGARYFENYYVTYGGSTLSSLNILDALGTYDFTGLTVYNWTTWRNFPDNVGMEIGFEQMTITPEPASLGFLGLVAALALRRR
ncbi:hypothetical protein RAS1_24120 [Phycisphaerae bacterium RAS1]|nr:hypothetical protein RAS1_24120 [Phycisphaerae bacterium RAS1]